MAVGCLAFTGCGDGPGSEKVEPGGAASTPKAAVVSPEAGFIQGTAATADGRPIRAFGGDINGYNTKSGQRVSASIEGADGRYRTEVGPGQFSTRAWTDIEYNGRRYRIDLDPADGKGGLIKQDTAPGVVKHFVWKLDGFRASADSRSYDRFYSHCGGSINLNPEGHGAVYWWNIKPDSKHAPEPMIPADATVELTLTPDGPLIDGSTGKPIVLRLKGADIKGPMDRVTRGIPIGRYHASARATLVDGSSRPLRVTPYAIKDQEPPAPAEVAVIEFVQSKPASSVVNGVDEIHVHVMY